MSLLLLNLTDVLIDNWNFFHISVSIIETLDNVNGYITVEPWVDIFMWMLIFNSWIVITIYSFYCLMRPTSVGYSYCFNHLIDTSAIFAIILHLLWVIFLEFTKLIQACVAIFLSTCAMVHVLKMQLKIPEKNTLSLRKEGTDFHIKILRICIINSSCLYASWLSYLTIMTLDACLVSQFDVDIVTTNKILTIFIMIVIVVYFTLDLLIIDRQALYLVGGYVSYAIGIFGTYKWQQEFVPEHSSIMANALILIILCLLGKAAGTYKTFGSRDTITKRDHIYEHRPILQQ